MSGHGILIWTWPKDQQSWKRVWVEIPPLLPDALATIMAEWLQRVSKWSTLSQVTHLCPPTIVRCVGCLAAVPMSYQPSNEALQSFKCEECQKGPVRSELIGTIVEIEFGETYRNVFEGTDRDSFHLHLNEGRIGSWSTDVPKGKNPPHKVGEQIIIDHWPTGYAEQRIEMPSEKDKEFFEAVKSSMEEGIEALQEGKPLKTTIVEIGEDQEEDSEE